MKVVQINATCGVGSTGAICVAVSRLLTEQGIENYILYSSGKSEYPLGIKYMDDADAKVQALRARIFGNYGFNSQKATKRLIAELERIEPDVVHLHNLHGHNCDLTMLFSYFKKKQTKLFWTFHDCWSFTAYCPHFSMIACDRWKTGCRDCPQYRKMSWFFDRSSTLYQRKKELFSGLNLTIITPSRWLADLVSQSFFAGYPIKVITNGIDLRVFKLTVGDFRQKHGLEDKHILLGVACAWDRRKGLDVFLDLHDRLDASKYSIVLVGTNDAVDKQLPPDIVSVHRTENRRALAEIYTAADVFVNPTREEVLGLVNAESLACGTPIAAFRTGGVPEVLDNTCGIVVEYSDVDAMQAAVQKICEEHPFSAEACVTRAESFSDVERFADYVSLYTKSSVEVHA